MATIVGTEGDDTLTGTWRDDVIVGLGGNDTITGASGADVICGGDGDDTISGASGADIIIAGDGNDTVDAGSQDDTVHGGNGDDDLNGGAGDDTLDGGNGFDVVNGLWDVDACDDAETALNCETETFNGEPDNPDGTTDPAPLTCNGLNATIVGTEGDDTIQGTWQNDVIVALGGNDVINAGSGEDTICAGEGNDTVNGQSQSDWIDAGPGDDIVTGADGDDTIFGGPGNDDLSGGSQADTIHGGDGDDTINGNSGNDILDGGNGTDVVDGSWQTDTCDDAETAISCETETNNGEPAGPVIPPVVVPLELVLVVGGSGDGVVEGQVSLVVESEDLVVGQVVTFAVDGRRIVDGAVGVESTWDTSEVDGVVVLTAVGVTEQGVWFAAEPVVVRVDNGFDVDDDGLPAEVETLVGSSSVDSDSDGDGFLDSFEAFMPGLDPLVVDDLDGDVDGDGLVGSVEQTLGLNPVAADTDGDGLDDGDELELGTFPDSPDSDGDGLLDGEEVSAGLNPFVRDSDGDGVLDGLETITVATADNGVTVALTGTGNIGSSFSATDVSDLEVFGGGNLSPVFELSVGPTATLDSAVVSIPYEADGADDPVLARWHPELNLWLPASELSAQSVADGQLTATLDSFSQYSVVDLREIRASVGTNVCALGVGPEAQLLVPPADNIRPVIGPVAAFEGQTWIQWNFVSQSDGTFFASPKVFRHEPVDPVPIDDGPVFVRSELARSGDVVLVNRFNEPLTAYDSTGALLWSNPYLPVSFRFNTQASVFVGRNFNLNGTSAALVGLNASTGTELFNLVGAGTPVTIDEFRNTVITTERVELPSGPATTIRAINLFTGSTEWAKTSSDSRYQLSGLYVTETSAVFRDANNLFVVRFVDGEFEPVDAPGLTTRSFAGVAGAANDADGNVVVVESRFGFGSGDFSGFSFYRISPAGQIIEQSDLPWSIELSPLIASSGRVGQVNGAVISLFASATDPSSPGLPTSSGQTPAGTYRIDIDVNGPLPTTVAGADTGSGEDSDLDGLPDCVETAGLRVGRKFIDSDPSLADSDDDGLSDSEEIEIITRDDFDSLLVAAGVDPSDLSIDPAATRVLVPRSSPRSPDGDGDGLTDSQEVATGTSAFVPDSDFDGISDFDEVEAGSDPLVNEVIRFDLLDRSRDECVGPPAVFLYLKEPVLVSNGIVLNGCVKLPRAICLDALIQVGTFGGCEDDATRLIEAAGGVGGQIVLEIDEPAGGPSSGAGLVLTREPVRKEIAEEIAEEAVEEALETVVTRVAPSYVGPAVTYITIGTAGFIITVVALDQINSALEPARELERAYERIVDRSLVQRDTLDVREIGYLRRVVRRCTHGEGDRASAAQDGRRGLTSVEFDNEPSAGPSGTVTTDFGLLGFTRFLGILRHVCETTPIYAPGEVKENSNTTASLLNYTTHHIRQALGWAPQDTINGQIAARTNTTDWQKWSGGVPDPITIGTREIRGRPFWTVLNRNTNGAPAAGGLSGRQWYNRVSQWCRQNRNQPGSILPPDGTVCDEFPFFSTSQGGPVPGLTASLKFVPGREQPELNQGNESSAQGVDLGRFYNRCSIEDTDPFFVIPMPDIRYIQNIFTQAGVPFAQPVESGAALPRPVADLLRSRFICEGTP